MPQQIAGRIARIEARAVRTLDRWHGNLPLVWGLTTVFAFGLIAIAIALGIGSVGFDGRLIGHAPVPFVDWATRKPAPHPVAVKEVGYVYALNWSLYSGLVAPLMLVLIVRVWWQMRAGLRAVADAGLVRDAALARVPRATLVEAWRASLRRCWIVFAAIFTATLLFVGSDWLTVVAWPMIDPSSLDGVTLADPAREFDWSIACLYPGEPVPCAVLGLFGALAYLTIAGVLTSAAFATCIAAVFYAFFVCGETLGPGRTWRLMAIPCAPDDERGGFGHFAPFFSALFGLSLAIVFGCVLMSMQNSYLRSPTASSIFRFLVDDTGALYASVLNLHLGELFDWLWAWLTEPLATMWDNPETAIGVMLFALTAIVTIGSSWWLLRASTRKARDLALANSAIVAAECGMSEDAVVLRLRALKLWPVGWMSQNKLLLMMVIMMASIADYRLILLPTLWVAWEGTKVVFDELFKRGP